MHPDAAFRHDDRHLLGALIDEIGFGMVFATTPDGPRVAHAAMARTSDDAVHFHLSRGNALTRHLDGMTALIVINGPESYISPRWYADTEQVPTWNYLALEIEGRVRQMDKDNLLRHLATLVDRQESRVAGGEPWELARVPPAKLHGLARGIVGFALEAQVWRPTFKLSQNKPAEERMRVADGLEAEGSAALARLMRTITP